MEHAIDKGGEGGDGEEGEGGDGEEQTVALFICSLHSLNNLNIEDIIPSSSSSSTHPMVTVINTPSIISQVHIPTLTQSPRNSATLYPPTTMSTSVKSLLSFKDLMVDRKRIAIGQVLKEGESGEGCGGGR